MRTRAGMIALVAALSALFGPPPASGDTGTRLSPFAVPGEFREVSAVPGTQQLYAVYYNRYTARLWSYQPTGTWTRQTIPAGTHPTQIRDVAMVSQTAGWATDARNGVLSFDGTAWHRVNAGVFNPADQFRQISANSANNVWVLGTREGVAGRVPALWHWNGQEWTHHPGPDQVDPGWAEYQIVEVAAIGVDDVWLLADNYSGTEQFVDAQVARWDGQQWTIQTVPESHHALDLAASSPTSIWVSVTPDDVLGANKLMHWDGGQWIAVDERQRRPTFEHLAATDDGVWALGHHQRDDGHNTTLSLLFTDGTTWASQYMPKRCQRSPVWEDLAVEDNVATAVGKCVRGDEEFTLAMSRTAGWRRI